MNEEESFLFEDVLNEVHSLGSGTIELIVEEPRGLQVDEVKRNNDDFE